MAAGVLRTDPRRTFPGAWPTCRPTCAPAPGAPAGGDGHRAVLFQANARTAIPVAQAAGAIVEAVAAGCEVAEYSPNRVKQTITGDGGAGKDQMERMVDPARHRQACDRSTPLTP